MDGFTFNGRHTNEFSSYWKTNTRPFLPTRKTVIENLPERDGEYDFSEVNIDGRAHYENRAFSGVLTVKASDMNDLHYRFTEIANWLCAGYCDLIFDDMPTTVWTAKVENIEQVTYELRRLGRIQLTFTVKPFSRYLYNRPSEPIILDSNTVLDTPFALDGEDYQHSVNGEQNILVRNYGDWYSAPSITATGNWGYLEIKCSDSKKIRYYGGCSDGDVVSFDFENNQVLKNGIPDNTKSLGHYWDFTPGENLITVLTDGTANLDIFMEFYFKYGAVME
ncbi:MAG: phage tail family protein [Clostridia bacterium]|nr:phage tail family protein [Clostridia bacterium]